MKQIITGKILHLDGDKKYSTRAYNYYKKAGLNAVVQSVSENMQPKIVYNLLKKYQPDILVITGHDVMLRKSSNFNDIYNYKNSKYFVEAVKEARRFDKDNFSNTSIFAGACQSYYEELIMAGANFASSPARILINYMDPIIIAEEIAITEYHKFISANDVIKKLRDGSKGVGGIGSYGKMTIV